MSEGDRTAEDVSGPVAGVCPECSSRLTDDPRFVSWCLECEYNIDPLSKDVDSASEQRRRDQEYQDALAVADRQRPTLSAVAAFVVATAVHVSTLSIAGLGAWLAAAYLPVPLGWMGLLLVVFALTLRPLLGRLPEDGIRIGVDSAPEFGDLLERVAAAVGTKRPDVVMVNDEYNMSFGRVGLRRRSVLTIGAPLWAALDGNERVAVLAHECGHDVNRDVRRGIWVGGAIQALVQWSQYVHPGPWPREGTPTEFVSYVAFAPLQLAMSWLVGGMAWVLLTTSAKNHRAAEFRADEIAVHVGGTQAAVRALGKLDLADTCMRRLKAVRNRGDRQLLDALRRHVAAIPAAERERLRRLSGRRGTAVDDSHPPTALRMAVVEHRSIEAQPMVTYSPAIDADLSEVMSEAERVLHDRLPHLHI